MRSPTARFPPASRRINFCRISGRHSARVRGAAPRATDPARPMGSSALLRVGDGLRDPMIASPLAFEGALRTGMVRCCRLGAALEGGGAAHMTANHAGAMRAWLGQDAGGQHEALHGRVWRDTIQSGLHHRRRPEPRGNRGHGCMAGARHIRQSVGDTACCHRRLFRSGRSLTRRRLSEHV